MWLGAGEGNRTLVCSLGRVRAGSDFNGLRALFSSYSPIFGCRFGTVYGAVTHLLLSSSLTLIVVLRDFSICDCATVLVSVKRHKGL
jgi:hypothetical protein